MLTETVVLPSSLTDARASDAALALLLDMASGGELVLDQGEVGVTELAQAVLRWGDVTKRDRAGRALRRLKARGRFIPLPPGDAIEGCSPACNVLRSVAARWHPDVLVCGAGCRSEVPGTAVVIGEYLGSSEQQLLQRRSITLSRRSATETELSEALLRPFTRYASSLIVHDRHIGRSAQESWLNGYGARVAQGFDLTVRALVETYDQMSRVPARSLRIVTGVWADREGAAEAATGLRRWIDDLRALARRVDVSLDLRGEGRGAQLNHDRYLISNQGAVMVSRGFDLLMTDAQMRERGLDPRRDVRPVHTVTLTHLENADEALLDAADLPPVE